jgi:chromosome segregation ATPase
MMRGEQDRLTMIDRQIEALQQGADDAAASLRGTPAESAQSRVQTLRRELADAQLTFTAKHPEVVRLQEELATAEKVAAAERARPAGDRVAVLQADPEYRALLKDREAAKLRIAELQRQQRNAADQIGQY